MVHRHMQLAEFCGMRHEESVANAALEHAYATGDHTALHAIRHIPDRDYGLSPLGLERGVTHRVWLARSGLLPFDVCVMSEFLRAQQTAHLLGIDGVEWLVDARLNERSWGTFGMHFLLESEKRDPYWKQAKERAPFDWRPEGGETLRERRALFAEFWQHINARFPGKRVLCVAHGETLEVAQAHIEAMSQERFAREERALRLGNGNFLRYVRGHDGIVRKCVMNPHTGIHSPWKTLAA